MGTYSMFKAAITVMLFYSIAITLFTHALPVNERNYLVSFNLGESSVTTDYSEISSKVEKNFESQTKVGVVEIGALVLYSGNLVLDLILNTFNAIPSMISVFFKAIFLFFPLDAELANKFILGVYAIVSVSWTLSVIYFLTQVRTQSGSWV